MEFEFTQVATCPSENMSAARSRSVSRRPRSMSDSPPLLSDYLISPGCHLGKQRGRPALATHNARISPSVDTISRDYCYTL